jgi:hypothetical protein
VSELNYEPRVILAHADRLNRRADSMGSTSAIIGAVIGGFFGAMPLTSLGDSWPIPHQFGFGTLLVGVLIGALTGYVIGDARAFGYRLQAQSSLCQLHLERNTAALLSRAREQSSSHEALPSSRPEPPAAPRVEAPRVETPRVEMPRVEYVAPEPEPAPPPAPVPVYVEPEPEPARLAEVPRHEVVVEPSSEPIRLAEAPRLDVEEPEPAPEPAPAPAPAEATPSPADLDSMSLEEIARLSNSGLI